NLRKIIAIGMDNAWEPVQKKRPVRGPGLQDWSFPKEISQAACPHAATDLFLNGLPGTSRLICRRPPENDGVVLSGSGNGWRLELGSRRQVCGGCSSPNSRQRTRLIAIGRRFP